MFRVAGDGAGGAGAGDAAGVVVPSPPQPCKLKETNAVMTVAKTALIVQCPLRNEKEIAEIDALA